ncbi:MAG: hypothetical protein MUF00_21545 [Gemmatimonadaceae bacterium]|jgi:hypothetical protein|nr:hypothetical protein [Gemmatimonadaceae bacterium]
MTFWLPVLFVVAVVVGARLARAARAHAELPAQLRARWGQPREIATELDDGAAEAWVERGTPSDAPVAGIDARTWDDLHLTRVLASIDHTETLLGAQLLYRRVRDGEAWADSPTLEPVASRCATDALAREQLGVVLASAGRGLGRGFWRLTTPDAIALQWWYTSFPLLTMAMLSAIAWTVFSDPRALLAVAGLAVLNMGVRAAATWQVPSLLTPIRQMTGVLATVERLVAIDALPAADRARIHATLAPLRPLRTIGRWVSRDATASNDLVASAWEYVNLLLLLDANALLFTGRRLRAHATALAGVATWIGEVDMARAVASLRAEPRAWCRPQWSERDQGAIVGAWHPLIPAPVANDVPLDARGGLVITGANMSGKSTYLRTAGVAAVLARSLDTCPATAWTGRILRVRSLIGRADDLASGRSYYMVEAEGVVALLQDAASAPPTLYLLDELLRGTNTVERIAAGEAVVRALAAPPGSTHGHTVLVATHDGELVALLHDQLAACHFRETIDADGMHFDHVRRDGPARTRTAMALLAVCGAPPALLHDARTRAAALDARAADGA